MIAESFLQYLTDNEDFKVTTVNERLDSGHYQSVYPLYHDIRLSAYVLLNQLELGSEEYVNIDKFYKFSTEFILRETFRFNTDLHEFNSSNISSTNNNNDSNDKHSDFEDLISQDFVKISTTYTLANSEAYFTNSAANIPLFTSLTQRSSLDQRNIAPPQDVQVTSILPHTIPSTIVQSLDMISPIPPRILQQQQQQLPNQPMFGANALQPYPTRDLLDRFLHPNWYSLPTAKWLANSDLQSFAPSVDEQTSVIPSSDKARLWFETVGYSKLFKSEKKEEAKTETKENGEGEKETNGSGSDKMEVDERELVLDDIELNYDQLLPTKDSINLTNLFEWHPSNTLTATEIEIFEKGEEQEYINLLLSTLSTLSSQREPKTPPSEEEIQIYQKVNFLLKEIILHTNEVPTVGLSKNMPVLQLNYNGVLPIPNQGLSKKKKASRR